MTAAAVPETETAQKRKGSPLPVLGAIWLVGMLFVAAIPKIGDAPPASPGSYAFWARVVPSMLGILGLLACLGQAKVGRPAGILVTEQNVISLSRLQTVLWTVLVLGFFVGIVLARAALGADSPLNVGVSGELWGLLGISTASLVGTPFLLTVRRDKEPVNAVDSSRAAADTFSEDPDSVAKRAQGVLYVNPTPADARFSDIFEGDEISNTHMVDLAKVQMFIFTIVTAIVWTIAALKLLGNLTAAADSVPLPALPAGMVTLLGVSNAGYLMNKLVDHTPTK